MKRGVYLVIGRWYWQRYQKRAMTAGTRAVAKQLRKQGVPVEVARAVLAARPIPTLTEVINLTLENGE